VKPRPSLLATIAALCVAVEAVSAQYVEDSIDVGAGWVGSLAYNSRADVMYGGCQEAGILFAISCDSNKVVSSLALDWPRYLDYDSVDNKGYVAHKGAGEDSLAVIDGSTHQVVKGLQMPGATVPVWDPASDRVYVSCQTTNKVAVVDCATDSLLTYIAVGACPIMMYINTLRRKLYVLNYDDGSVSIVNMTTNQVVKTVATEAANAGYYCLCADKFYCSGPQRQCVVIGGQSDTIVARIPVPGSEYVLSATGNEQAGIVFAGMFCGNSGYIVAIDAGADSVMYTHDLGHALAEGLLYSTESGQLYSANYPNSVSVLTGDGARVIKTIPLGDAPFVIAAAPAHRRLYVGNNNSSFVYVLRDVEGVSEPQSPRTEFRGSSVTPNPFAQSVAVVWPSPAKERDVARVYAQDGRLVRQVRIPAGEARWVWDGRDDSGALIPPGVYVLESGPGVRAKVVKLK